MARPRIRFLAALLLTLSAGGASATGQVRAIEAPASRPARAPLGNGDIRSLELGAPPGTRTWTFRLVLDGTEQAGGIARWVVGPDPLERNGWRVQVETVWFDGEENLRVLSEYRGSAHDRRLLWRELGPTPGRTVLARSDSLGGIEVQEIFGVDGIHHLRFSRALFLLECVERFRRGSCPDEFPLFDPLSRSVERISARQHEFGSHGQKLLDLRRDDGTVVGQYLFEGGRLIGYRLQRGGFVARPLEAARFDAILEAREEERARAIEARAETDRVRILSER